MKWEVFGGRKTEKPGKTVDLVDQAIRAIERFAPNRYKSEREVHYYNYRIMPRYRAPLLELLQSLVHRERFKQDLPAFAPELFLKLKDFYDIRRKLSLPQALEDKELRRRFQSLLFFFYGEKHFQMAGLEGSLKDMDRTGG